MIILAAIKIDDEELKEHFASAPDKDDGVDLLLSRIEYDLGDMAPSVRVEFREVFPE